MKKYEKSYKPLDYRVSLEWVKSNFPDTYTEEVIDEVRVLIFNQPTYLPYSLSKTEHVLNIYNSLSSIEDKREFLFQHIATYSYINYERKYTVLKLLWNNLNSQFTECDISKKFLKSKVEFNYSHQSKLIRNELVNYITDRDAKLNGQTKQKIMKKYNTIAADRKHEKVVKVYNTYKNRIYNMTDLSKFLKMEHGIEYKNDSLNKILKKEGINYKKKTFKIGEVTLNYTTKKEYEYLYELRNIFNETGIITTSSLKFEYRTIRRFWDKNKSAHELFKNNKLASLISNKKSEAASISIEEDKNINKKKSDVPSKKCSEKLHKEQLKKVMEMDINLDQDDNEKNDKETQDFFDPLDWSDDLDLDFDSEINHSDTFLVNFAERSEAIKKNDEHSDDNREIKTDQELIGVSLFSTW